MQSNNVTSHPLDRLTWLWLAIGAILLPFANIQTVWPIAAWLSPVFLVRFSRTQPLKVGLPVILLAQIGACAIGLRNDYAAIPAGPLFVGAILVYGLLFWLPFLLDRLLVARLPGALRTLVFPLAAVTVNYLLLFTPFHTLGTPAYTQYSNLPLMQLVSLTGIWGLTFLISWLAPVVNEVWEQGAALHILRYSLLPFALVLAGVLVYGSSRLSFTPNAPTVRVAGLTPDRTLWSYLPVADIARSSDVERSALHPKLMQIVTELLSRSRQEALAGAKIITWSETAAFVLQEDEPTVLEQARALAHEETIYLQIGLMVIRQTQQFPFGENRAIMIDPAGNVVWDYHKAFPVPTGDGQEIAAGPAIIPITQTPFGRLASVICFDLDWLPYPRQAGLGQVGLVLVPADDWLAIENDHANSAVYRAIENGFSMIRPTSKGISLVVDPLGRELARGEYYTTDRLTIVAEVPVQALPTLYSQIGDVFAYAFIIALIAVTILGILRIQGVTVDSPRTT
jgi:apolipoprotein N-acyltransferase